jgi:hypothetical protein
MPTVRSVIAKVRGRTVFVWDETKDRKLSVIRENLESVVNDVLQEIKRRGGVKANRVNDAGPLIEHQLRNSLKDPDRPASGRFPDIPVDPKLTHEVPVDLEVKTILEGNESQAGRTFYLHPPLDYITRDSYILIVTVMVRRYKNDRFIPIGARIIDGSLVEVRFIKEYNAGNKAMTSRPALSEWSL